MSATIKRIEKLKARSRKVVERFDSIDPLAALSPEYVTSSGLTRSDLSDKIDSLRECANVIELREHITGDEKGYERGMTVAAANFCKQHALCPVCADRMQSRRRAKYNDPVKNQAKRVSSGERYAYMITYTVTDKESLSDRIECLKEGKKTFRRMGQKRSGYYSGGEWAAIRAGVSTVEIKRGKSSGLWHVHSHDLVFTDRPIDYRIYDQDKLKKLRSRFGQRIPEKELLSIALHTAEFRGKQVPVSKISSEWLLSTGGDSINISVDPIRHIPKNCSPKKRRMYRKMSFEESVAYQARECMKYPYPGTYKGDNEIEDMLTVLNDTYNKRMVESFGEFRGINRDDYNDPPENEIENFVMVWKDGHYSGAIPGGVRIQDGSDDATETRKKAGVLLGSYRRQRKEIVSMIPRHPDVNFAEVLDEAKEVFRRQYNAIWSVFRAKKQAAERMASCIGDFSPVLAAAGMFIPGSDSRDIYCNAFQ